jgi:hypothetical protein
MVMDFVLLVSIKISSKLESSILSSEMPEILIGPFEGFTSAGN